MSAWRSQHRRDVLVACVVLALGAFAGVWLLMFAAALSWSIGRWAAALFGLPT